MASRRTSLAAALVAPWVGWALVRTFGLDLRHPVVAAVSFTPYVAATAWLPVVAALLLRRRAVALVGAVAGGLLGAAVLPRALGDGRVSVGAEGPTLRVMTANVYVGRADMAAIVRLAREQDIDVPSAPGGPRSRASRGRRPCGAGRCACWPATSTRRSTTASCVAC